MGIYVQTLFIIAWVFFDQYTPFFCSDFSCLISDDDLSSLPIQYRRKKKKFNWTFFLWLYQMRKFLLQRSNISVAPAVRHNFFGFVIIPLRGAINPHTKSIIFNQFWSSPDGEEKKRRCSMDNPLKLTLYGLWNKITWETGTDNLFLNALLLLHIWMACFFLLCAKWQRKKDAVEQNRRAIYNQ